MLRIPMHRPATHPGEMLREEFLKPLGLSQRDLAERIDVPYQRVNELVNRRRGVTPATALQLARVFGTTPGFWMNLQLRWDLYRAQAVEVRALRGIRPIRTAS
jgi:antitoxin HigA-1